MNDEIKEILDYLKKKENTRRIKCITTEESKHLLDYITNLQEQLHQASLQIQELIESDAMCPTVCDKLINLQQENDRLKDELERLHNLLNSQAYRDLDDYKSRCEKASDKLSFIDKALESDTLNVPLCIVKINSALNILQNGSDSR